MQTVLKISAACKYIGTVYSLVEQHGGTRSSEDFESDGSVVLHVSVVDDAADRLAQHLGDATAGNVHCRVL